MVLDILRKIRSVLPAVLLKDKAVLFFVFFFQNKMCALVTNASALPHDLHVFIFQCRTPAEEPPHDHLAKHLHSFRAFSPMFTALLLKQMHLLVYRVQKL